MTFLWKGQNAQQTLMYMNIQSRTNAFIFYVRFMIHDS